MGTSAYHPSDGKRLYLQLRECLGHRYTPKARSIKNPICQPQTGFLYTTSIKSAQRSGSTRVPRQP